MKVVKGDIIKLTLACEFDLIVHGCNCFCVMGAGVAKQIRKAFPEAFETDLKTPAGDVHKLGTFSYVVVQKNVKHGDVVFVQNIGIVNAYTQYNYGTHHTRFDYEALRKVFRSIKDEFSGLRIAYPKIGAGLGKGDWNTIAKIIDEELNGEDHTLVEYVE